MIRDVELDGPSNSIDIVEPCVIVARRGGVPVGSTVVLASTHVDVEHDLEKRAGDPLPPASTVATTVTVAVCTRHRPDLLARCLGSIIKAVERAGVEVSVELLVVDNGSRDDGTVAAAIACDSRVVAEPVPGLNVARNRAIEEAAGGLVAFVDDDVVVDELWLRTLVRTFAAHPECVAVTGGVLPYRLETAAQREFERCGGFFKGWRAGAIASQERRTAFDPSIGVGCNMAFRREMFASTGPFDEALDTGPPLAGGGDLDILIRAMMNGEVIYEPSAMVFHEHRRTARELRKQFRSWGTSWGAVLHKWHRTAPALRPQVRRAALQAIRWYGHDLLVGGRGGRLTRFHALHMLIGFVSGSSFAYPRSRRRMARRRAQAA